MIENLPIRIDEVGRIVIPKKVRKKCNIKKDCILSLITNEKSILLTKQNDEIELSKLLDKIHKIEEFYNFDTILTDKEKILYASNKYKYLKQEKVSNDVRKIINEKIKSEKFDLTKSFSLSDSYYYSLINFNNYTKYLFIIIYENEESRKIAYLISKLLT